MGQTLSTREASKIGFHESIAHATNSNQIIRFLAVRRFETIINRPVNWPLRLAGGG